MTLTGFIIFSVAATQVFLDQKKSDEVSLFCFGEYLKQTAMLFIMSAAALGAAYGVLRNPWMSVSEGAVIAAVLFVTCRILGIMMKSLGEQWIAGVIVVFFAAPIIYAPIQMSGLLLLLKLFGGALLLRVLSQGIRFRLIFANVPKRLNGEPLQLLSLILLAVIWTAFEKMLSL